MSFDDAIARVQALGRETLAILSDIERGAVLRSVDAERGLKRHDQRMAYIREQLAAIDENLRRLKDLL